MVAFLLAGFHLLKAPALKINRESIVIAAPRVAGRRATVSQAGSGSFFVPAAILLLLFYLTVLCATLAPEPTKLAASRYHLDNKQAAQYKPLSSATHHKRSRRDVAPAESLASRWQDLTPASVPASDVVPAANANFEAAFQGECGKNNNSNPCGHICLDLYDGTYECSCFYGFTLAVDGYSCTPVAPPISAGTPKQLPLADNGTTSSRQASRLQSRKSHQSTVTTTLKTTTLTTAFPAATATSPEFVALSNVALSGQPRAMESDERTTGASKKTPHRTSSRRITDSDTEFLIEDANDIRKLADDLSGGTVLRETHLTSRTVSSLPRDRHHSENIALLNRKRRLLEDAFKNHNKRYLENVASTLPSKHPSKHSVSHHKDNQHYLHHHFRELSDTTTTTTEELNQARTSKETRSGYVPEQPMVEPKLTGSEVDSTSRSNDNNDNEDTHKQYSLREPVDSRNQPKRLDADIKSIMLANDQLLSDLFRLLEAGLTSHTPPTKTLPHNHKQLPNKVDLAEAGSQDELLDLRMLDDLIRKSVEDYQALWVAFRGPSNSSSNESSVGGGQAAATSKPPQASIASGAYSSCREMPECQAGGLCTMEQVDGFQGPAPIKSGPRCRCPLGRTGLLCQRTALHTTVPSFSGHSYLALPLPQNTHLTHLRLLFRPSPKTGRQPSLLLSAPSFTLLLDELNRVQLKYTSASGGATRVMGSRDARFDTWNELIVTPDASNDSNMIEPHQQQQEPQFTYQILHRIVLVTPAEIPLAAGFQQEEQQHSRYTQLFVAGLPQFAETGLLQQEEDEGEAKDGGSGAEDASNRAMSLPGGLRGCIKELSINARSYNFNPDLRGDAVDGFDIDECKAQTNTLFEHTNA